VGVRCSLLKAVIWAGTFCNKYNILGKSKGNPDYSGAKRK
jgi:hypothetical protein